MSRATLFAAAFFVVIAGCQEVDDTADTAADTAAFDTSAAVDGDITADASVDALVDPAEASREELLAVPGMTEEAADAVIDGRPYEDMLEVDAILADHLDENEREEVYRHLWKPLDLNEASDEEILLIPGVGEQMAHEFDEYRPYRGIEEFRREIGKYVDAETVAGYERYVEIR